MRSQLQAMLALLQERTCIRHRQPDQKEHFQTGEPDDRTRKAGRAKVQAAAHKHGSVWQVVNSGKILRNVMSGS